jgi:hypothetical protein
MNSKQLSSFFFEQNMRNSKRRHRLSMDRSNHDKPPSSDDYQKKTVKPGLPKDKNGHQGGQAGHKDKTLKLRDNAGFTGLHSALRKRKSSKAGKYLTCRR